MKACDTMKRHFFRYIISIIILMFIAFLLIEPQICSKGIANGILLCGRVIIPSLFPFTVSSLFLIKTQNLVNLKVLNKFTTVVFSLPLDLFLIMLFSFIGGYPIGAKLLNESVIQKKISPKQAGKMLNFCINAGPAFIISAVGSIIGSKLLGVILLISHLLSSVIVCLICRFKSGEIRIPKKSEFQISIADSFVISTSQATSSILSICSFVILFSCINSYIEFFSIKVSNLKLISYLLEVTNAVTLTNNIFLIAFLLGFGGVCIWCQIFEMGKNIKINFFSFVCFRFLHGILSATITFLILRLSNISIPTFTNNTKFNFSLLYSTPSLAISMVIMCMVLIISITTKKYTGKILEDMI